jgi:hypothetical protein
MKFPEERRGSVLDKVQFILKGLNSYFENIRIFPETELIWLLKKQNNLFIC